MYLWKYSKEDKTTWKYIDVVIEGNKKFVSKWILNPDFAYKHLDPFYKE